MLKDYPAAKAGTPVEGNENEYLVLIPDGTVPDMWELMLPFGAIDETVRAGGSGIVTPFDDTAAYYDTFIGHTPVKAVPYDNTLLTKGEKDSDKVPQYGLKPTAAQTIHYGDWPIYETYVVNS